MQAERSGAVFSKTARERGACIATSETSGFKENGWVRPGPAGLQCSTLWEILVYSIMYID